MWDTHLHLLVLFTDYLIPWFVYVNISFSKFPSWIKRYIETGVYLGYNVHFYVLLAFKASPFWEIQFHKAIFVSSFYHCAAKCTSDYEIGFDINSAIIWLKVVTHPSTYTHTNTNTNTQMHTQTHKRTQLTRTQPTRSHYLSCFMHKLPFIHSLN